MSNPRASLKDQARRSVNACRRCKQRKVKCSGSAPCLSCVRRGQSCIFDKSDRRILVSERHLRDLERRATTSHIQSPRRNNAASPVASAGDHRGQHDQTSEGLRVPGIPARDQGCTIHHRQEGRLPAGDPLFSLPMNTETEPEKGRAHNRHMSTSAFIQEIRQILDPRYSEESRISEVMSEVSYNIPLHAHEPQFESLNFCLPPKDHIIYLAQVANFHFNANHVFFNYTAFSEEVSKTSPQNLQMASGIWRVRILLIIALGKLCLEKGATSSGPPGVREFVQGVNVLPSNIELIQDSLMSIEALCLLAIYAQAADMHDVAYLYTGQASRIARSCGLNRGWHCFENTEPSKRNYAQGLWRTVCVLDQRHSAAIGANPDYLYQEQNDSLISWDENSDRSSDLALQFNLSVATSLSRVMAVFSKHAGENIMSSSFMNSIAGELQSLRNLGRQMSTAQQLCCGQSLLTISRPVATLHLFYYHCIILAAKPVLVHLTKLCFNNGNHFASANASSALAFSITQTSANAASHSLNIISALHEQDLLEMFLFFNLEITFLAALSLVLANFLLPNITESAFLEVAKSVLEDMSRKGNVPATFLKGELDDMCRLASYLPPPSRRRSHSFTQRKTINVLQDGLALNNAIRDVIEIHGTTNFEPELRQGTAPYTSTENLQPSEIQEPPIPVQSSSPFPTSGIVPHASGIHVGNADLQENMFSGLDLADIQWFDSIQ